MSEDFRARPSGARSRVGLAAVLALAAAATGLFWAGQRSAREVDASASINIAAAVDETGALEITEDLVVSDHRGDAVTRLLAATGGVALVSVSDEEGRPVPHTALEVTEGLAVTMTDIGPAAVLHLRYTLLGATSPGRDAVELAWPIVDDRSPLALTSLEMDISWEGGGAAEVLTLDAPGGSPTVVSSPGHGRIVAGPVPAHRDVEVHAALPLSSVPEGVREDRSVMAAMADAGPTTVQPGSGGGPWWVAAAVTLASLVAWAAVHHRLGREPAPSSTLVATGRPSRHSPAELAWLLRRGSGREEDIAATLLDLHARGAITTEGDGRWRLTAATDPGPAPHEAVLLRWCFGAGPALDLADLEARVRTDPAGWREVRRAFADAVEAEGRADRLVHRTVEDEAVLGAGVAAAALTVLGVAGTAFGQPAWLACTVVGVGAFVMTDSLAHVTPHGADVAAGWARYAVRLREDDGAAAALPGHALVLGARGPQDDPQIAAVTEAVSAAHHAFVEATSFVSAPRRRLLGG